MSNRTQLNMRRQSGAALIVSLLLLLILTVLGAVMMQTSRMQERMAGNTRDLNLALQGAEAGLRYGEALVASYNAATMPDQTSAMPCAICQPNVLPIAVYDPSQFNWLTNASAFGAGPVAATLIQANGLKENPRYATEYVNTVRDDASPTSSGIDYYQVSSHSSGGSGLANVVLQSTYSRRPP